MIQFCIRWLISKTYRQAVEMRRTVIKITRAQTDLLKPESVVALHAECDALKLVIDETADKEQLTNGMKALEKVATKHLQPYPNAVMRENIEVVLVAVAVAMGIRTFFLQPFKIPTGSMQPTLYGITSQEYRGSDEKFAGKFTYTRFVDSWLRGYSYYEEEAKVEGRITRLDPEPVKVILPFIKKQRFWIGNEAHTVWFPPDKLWQRAGLRLDMPFKKGQEVMRLKVISGDHLFVDRLTYNFRKPDRGEIIVFATKGVNPSMLPQNQFYIKRLVATGDEVVQIGDDRRLIINGERLDAHTPRFEHMYGFQYDPLVPPIGSTWSGHANNNYRDAYGRRVAPLFDTEATEFKVRTNHFLVMGDNTLNSSDSRAWGDFSRTNVIGKSAFVYWPIFRQEERNGRFGWCHR
ncbi:MAG: signal peptidase I [Limisphaerales bacterium]